MSAPSTKRIIVNFSRSGTATDGVDYSKNGSRRIIIPAGQTTGSTFIPIVDDKLKEGSESLVLDFAAISNATAGSITRQTITIVDND